MNSGMGGRVRTRVNAMVLAGLLFAVAVLSGFHAGIPVAELRLHDGGVWVTNAAKRLAAHLNYPSQTLDGGVVAAGGSFDVSQSGNDVVMLDSSLVTGQVIDTAALTMSASTSLKDYTVSQGADTFVIADEKGGRVWALPVRDLPAFTPDAAPIVKDVGGARALATTDGAVLVWDRDLTVRRLQRSGSSWESTDRGRLAGSLDKDVKFTAVGDELVAYSPSSGTLTTTKAQVRIDDPEGSKIQEPGPGREHVLVATRNALLQVPIDGTPVRSREAGPARSASAPAAIPAAPVRVGDCDYAAWGGSGRYLRDCPTDGDDRALDVPSLTSAKSLVFRVNRQTVVLNDVANGDAYVVNDKAELVNNWKDITRQLEQREQSQDKATRTVEKTTAPDRSKDNRPPIAVPDEFGARPGRSTTLPVLENDSDPDGDVLTAEPTTQPGFGAVAAVRGGEAVQITLPAAATGVASFDYAADDGRGQKATATVKVTVRPPDVNDPPKQRRAGSAKVEQGKDVAVNALQNWWDPDGDPLILKSAVAPDGLSVRYRQDGTLWVTDLGTRGPDQRDVSIVVSDGRKDAEGKITVEVLAKGNAAPIANADHATVFVGRPALVKPLANDTDANGDPLRLATVGPAPAGLSVAPDLTAGTVSITAQKAGSSYLPYTVTDGPTSAAGFIRVTALEPRPGAAPTPDADTILLPAGGSASADVLANDSDPGGGVLLVQSVAVPSGTPLLVQIVDHGVLRVEAPGGLAGPTAFEYVVSNGAASATGRVTVVPMPPAAPGAAPIALPDRGVVRASDIVSIPVLANDSSPAGLPLTLAPAVQVLEGGSLGQAFVSDGMLRFRARAQAGTATATYTAADSLGQVASGTATITIRAANDGNAAPTPRPLTARVLAGMTTKIRVPLDGVDPDGDSVTLDALATGPSKGTAKVTGGVIEYTAPVGSSGTDVFSYALTDPAGGRGIGSVQVGIAPVATTNSPPVVGPDRVIARPDRALSIPVLANDADPDGDSLSLVSDSVHAASPATGVVARADGNRIALATPSAAGVLSYVYEVDDGHGGRARGSLTVDVRSDAPLLAPVARDDAVAAADVAGRDSVEVDVLRNDDDPDGDVRRLTISSDDPGVRAAGGKLTVPVTDRRAVYLYTVTDGDGLAARAAVVVPPRAGQPPRLRDERFPLRVKAGETLTVKLADVVIVRDGRSARITSDAGVSAGAGSNGKPLVVDPTTLTYTSTPTFRGLTALNAEVTDGGGGAGDQGALTALLSMPVVVEGPGGTPPTVRPTEVVLTPGQPAKRVDLGPMITDPDPGDAAKATVRLGTVSPGFTVSLDGRTLVAAAADAKDGALGTADITVTDGSTEPVAAKVPLRVQAVPENRPPMVVTEAVLADVRPGETREVDITRYVTNPYADQGKPLTLVGAPVVRAGSGTASAAGTTVRVAVGAQARGEVVATYVVADASGKPERQAQGTIRLRMRVPPEAPSGVTARADGGRAAVVSWTSGPANGSPITKVTVSWTGGSKDCGAATSCAITGLSAGAEYQFTVVATSAAGDSPPSAPSNRIRLTSKPGVPGTPSARAGDKKVDLTWAASNLDGGGPVRYVVQVSPGGAQREATGTSMTWDGLTNGTSYTFRVQAKAPGAETSDWSASSGSVTPRGVPGRPQAPKIDYGTGNSATYRVLISWAAPDWGGEPSGRRYEVRRSDGKFTSTVDTVTASTIDSTASGLGGLTYSVRAENSAGWGPWSPESNPTSDRTFNGTISDLRASPTGVDNQVRLVFTAPSSGSIPAGDISYTWSASGKTGSIPAGGGLVTDSAFANGRDVPVVVSGRVKDNSRPFTSNSVTVNAYGPPRQVTVTSQVVGVHQVDFRWNGSGAANGRPISHVEIGAFRPGESISTSGRHEPITGQGILNTNFATAYRFRAVDQLGGAGPWSEATSIPAAPPPRVPAPTYSMTRFVPPEGYPMGCTPGCMSTYGYGVTLRNYRPNSQVQCTVVRRYGPPPTRNFAVDASGAKEPEKADFAGTTGETLTGLTCRQL